MDTTILWLSVVLFLIVVVGALRSVLDDHWLLPALRQALGNDPGHHVRRSARGKAHQYSYRSVRKRGRSVLLSAACETDMSAKQARSAPRATLHRLSTTARNEISCRNSAGIRIGGNRMVSVARNDDELRSGNKLAIIRVGSVYKPCDKFYVTNNKPYLQVVVCNLYLLRVVL